MRSYPTILKRCWYNKEFYIVIGYCKEFRWGLRIFCVFIVWNYFKIHETKDFISIYTKVVKWCKNISNNIYKFSHYVLLYNKFNIQVHSLSYRFVCKFIILQKMPCALFNLKGCKVVKNKCIERKYKDSLYLSSRRKKSKETIDGLYAIDFSRFDVSF